MRTTQLGTMILWFVAASVGLLACQPPSDGTAACRKLSSERIQVLAWSPAGDVLALMTGRSTAPSWSAITIDRASRRTLGSIDAPGALDAMTVDGAGRPTWVAAEIDGGAFLDRWEGDRVTRLGRLPHPNFFHLMGTEAGLMALETRVQQEVDDPPEASRVVRLSIADGLVATHEVTAFDPATIDADVSRDGLTTATVSQSGDITTLDVVGTVNGSRVVPSGARSVDLWVEGGSVGYLGDDGIYRIWKVADDREGVLDQYWASVGALSTGGDVALAELSDSGPSGEVCIVDATSTSYGPP